MQKIYVSYIVSFYHKNIHKYLIAVKKNPKQIFAIGFKHDKVICFYDFVNELFCANI